MFGAKVLIVDDDPELVALVSNWLRKEGFETCSAGDGASCIAQARSQKPDVIVLDIGLPAGDGLTALGRLKKNMHTAGIPVVVLSAKSAEEASASAISAGAVGYVEKTGSRAQFVDVVRAAMENTDDESDCFQ